LADAGRRPLAERPPLAVYIHWPFCAAKCPYCDFNSHVREAIDETRWRVALAAEINHFAALVPNHEVTSIFFGGGTPALMDPATVGALIAQVAAHWPLATDVEITLEANPTSAEAARFAAFAANGVNRLSLGVQALDDEALAALGRRHDAAMALDALAMARAVFDRVSFDLIYARPGQDAAGWAGELRRALDLSAGHLSAYQLTIERGTAFYQARARGDLVLPDEEEGAAFYEITQELCAAAGLPAYEVSNHAAAGQECRHNLSYWRMEDYIGVGPGSHGRPAGRATEQHRSPERWLAAVERAGHGTRSSTPLGPRERDLERLMMGLRLREGVDLARLEDPALINPGPLIAEDFLEIAGSHLRTTARGAPLLNAVLGALVV